MKTRKHYERRILKKVIQGKNSEVLNPVTKIVWNLHGVSEEEIIALAKEINEQLGYESYSMILIVKD